MECLKPEPEHREWVPGKCGRTEQIAEQPRGTGDQLAHEPAIGAGIAAEAVGGGLDGAFEYRCPFV